MNKKRHSPKARQTWGDMNPVTRVVQSRKNYNRKDKSWKRGAD